MPATAQRLARVATCLALAAWIIPSVAVAQVITNFSPYVGAVGDSVVIGGSGFSSGTMTVRFYNGVVASSFVNDDLHITATVPAGAISGPITVQKNSLTPVSSVTNFYVIGHGPYISGFSPSFGAVNDPISIFGVHLTNATAVKFNGTNAPSFVSNADGTQINCFVPTNATSGFISVTTAFGTSNSPAPFTVIGRGPYVTNFNPTFGPASQLVMIRGVHFNNATNVMFNGKLGTGFVPGSDTQIQVNAPSGVTTGPLTVLSSFGAAFNFTTTNLFYAPPVVSSVSPFAGRAGTNLLILGVNFTDASSVDFCGTGGAFTLHSVPTVLSNGAIQVTVPTGVTTGQIQIQTPANSPFATSSNFVVQPTLFGFSPASGDVGTNVTITGANFNVAGLVVKFGNVQAAPPSGVTFSQLTAKVPVGATNAAVTVTTQDGSDTSSTLFYLPPVISGFTPTNSAPGTIITINGQNLLGVTSVSFNGTLASFTPPANNTSMTVTVPTNFNTGPITVASPGGTTNSGPLLFYAAPVITGFSPSHGLPGDSVSISGNNFLGATGVTLNGVAATFVPPANNTQIQAIVPTNVLTGPIRVTGPAGTSTSSTNFVLDFLSDMAVTITDSPDPVFVTSNLTYTITVTNAGPFNAQNAVLTNTLPASAILVSNNTSSGTLSVNGNRVIGAFGSLAAGNSIKVTLVVAPQAAGSIMNSAVVASDYTDPNSANNSVSITTTVLPLPFLTIAPYSAGLVQISWPLALSNFSLQYNSALSAGSNWANLGTPPIVSGTNNVVIDPSSGPAKFYRLKQ